MTTTDTTIETRHDRRITVDHYDDKTVLEIVNTITGRVLGAGLTPGEARQIAAALDPGRAAGGQWTRYDFARLDIHPLSPAGEVIDEVVAWLNAHYPKPQPYDQGGVRGADSLLYRAERERDAAVARADEWEQKAKRYSDKFNRARSFNVEMKARAERAERVLRERDEQEDDATRAACERAEQAERDRDEAIRERRQMEDDHAKMCREWRGMDARVVEAERERDEWKARAEAAEADNADAKIDGDPAVHVVRESDLPAARVDGDYYVVASAKGDYKWPQHGPSWWAGRAQDALAEAARYTSLARLAADREATVDPVEELAEQIETATRAAIRQACDDLAGVVPALDPLAVEQAMEVRAASRKVAAHVLGQEASSDE